ncbi:MAG: hypothetical protein Q8880_08845, partial [Bacteroidota bacterium]|nr:hypothetical protein [Bacteroidota bacterium]
MRGIKNAFSIAVFVESTFLIFVASISLISLIWFFILSICFFVKTALDYRIVKSLGREDSVQKMAISCLTIVFFCFLIC